MIMQGTLVETSDYQTWSFGKKTKSNLKGKIELKVMNEESNQEEAVEVRFYATDQAAEALYEMESGSVVQFVAELTSALEYEGTSYKITFVDREKKLIDMQNEILQKFLQEQEVDVATRG